MKHLKYNEINVDSSDDFVYRRLVTSLYQIKLILGGTGLDSTLRKHPKLFNYAKAKASKRLDDLEQFFMDDGSLNHEAVKDYVQKHPLLNA